MLKLVCSFTPIRGEKMFRKMFPLLVAAGVGAVIALVANHMLNRPAATVHNMSVADLIQMRQVDPSSSQTVVGIKRIGSNRLQFQLSLIKTWPGAKVSTTIVTLKRNQIANLVQTQGTSHSWVRLVYNLADVKKSTVKSLRSEPLAKLLTTNLDYANVALAPALYKEVSQPG